MKYRRKPIEVDAFQWKLLITELPKWFLSNSYQYDIGMGNCLLIHTLSGTLVANPGDWVINGLKDLEVLEPRMFEASYERISFLMKIK